MMAVSRLDAVVEMRVGSPLEYLRLPQPARERRLTSGSLAVQPVIRA
jgi:hypothetical protein